MNGKCRKCGFDGQWAGPFYQPGDLLFDGKRLLTERLAWHCPVCHYVKYSPCLDAKPGTDVKRKPDDEVCAVEVSC